MVIKPRFRAVADTPVRVDANGNPFVVTASGKRQFLKTTAPPSATHGDAGVEDSEWLRPGDPDGPTWGTGWTDYDATHNEVVVAIKRGSTVSVRGQAKRTTGASLTIMKLPPGMRPTKLTSRPATYNEVGNAVYVSDAGAVTMSSTAVYTNGQGVAFEFQFDTDQP